MSTLKTIQLTDNQIAQQWPTIAKVIEGSVESGYNARQFTNNNVFQAFMKGQMQAWAIVPADGEQRVVALATTRIVEDSIDPKALAFTAFYGFEHIPDSALKDGLETIIAFARANAVKHLYASSNNPWIIRQANMLGFDTFKTHTWSI